MNEYDKIELRSEKVKKIIGTIPPLIIRMGISAIFFVIILILFAGFLLKFNNVIKAKAQVYQNDSITSFIIKLPVNKISEIKPNQKIVINFFNTSYNDSFEISIPTTNKKIFISDKEAYYLLKFNIDSKSFEDIQIIDTINVNISIIAGKTNLFHYFLEQPYKF